MTFAAGDAHDFCIYKGRFRFAFPILDLDGDPVTSAAGLDSERSIDFATGADCTNEATEFTTAPIGMYFLDLTSAETTGNNVSGVTKTSTTDAKATTWSIPIVRLPILESGTAQAGAAGTITLASGASAKDNFYAGLYIQCSNDSPANVLGQTRKIISYVGSTKVATVGSNWGTNPSSATTYDILIPTTANIAAIQAQRMPDWATAGVPAVDVANWKGTAVATPGTAGVPSVDTLRVGGTVQTGRDIGASVLLSSGTGTGQLDFTSGVVKSNMVQILASAITGTAANIVGAFTKFFDKTSPTGTINSIPDAVAGATGGLFIAGTNAATTVTTSLTTTFTGNLTGSVGSVTGAVGSVTGSVGSVTALAANSVNASALATDAVTEVTDAISALVGADPAAVPATNATWLAKLDWICARLRNKETFNRSTGVWKLRNNADSADIGTYTATDDGTTTTVPKAT